MCLALCAMALHWRSQSRASSRGFSSTGGASPEAAGHRHCLGLGHTASHPLMLPVRALCLLILSTLQTHREKTAAWLDNVGWMGTHKADQSVQKPTSSLWVFAAKREIGCIVRSLGCFPTEAEVQELLTKIEVEEPGGFVHLGNFLPVMTKVLLDRRFQPIPEDVILHAFEALDENKCGYITKEDLVKHLTEEGEPFNLEEMEDMLAVALDPETDTLHYRDYRTKLVVDETKNFPFKVWDAFR